MALAPGDVIAAKYELQQTIGEGGMGFVFAAKHLQLGTRVAIKVLRPEVLVDQEAVARFDREARAAASISSPNILRIFDVGRLDDGVPYMVSELLEGTDLGAELAARGRLSLAEAADYLIQASEAMAEAHQRGVIHRDLKPSNLFLVRSQGRTVVKILDFGISKIVEDTGAKMTQTQSAFGTPLYMSPEQVRSTKSVDPRTDVWSLGVILYELLTGAMPFRGETLTAVAVSITLDNFVAPSGLFPELPKAVDAVVAQALAKSPDDRFQSAGAFADALRPFIRPAARPSVPMSEPGPERTSRVDLAVPAVTQLLIDPDRRTPERRGWRVAAVVLGLSLVTSVSYGLWRSLAPAASVDRQARSEANEAPGDRPAAAAFASAANDPNLTPSPMVTPEQTAAPVQPGPAARPEPAGPRSKPGAAGTTVTQPSAHVPTASPGFDPPPTSVQPTLRAPPNPTATPTPGPKPVASDNPDYL